MPMKGGDIVPIRWNAKRVEEAADMLEEEVNNRAIILAVIPEVSAIIPNLMK